MEFLSSYPSNVTKMLSKNGRISSSDVEILKTPFPSDFPNAAEVEKLKNSKISKKTFEIMHFMNFQRAVDNMMEYRNGEFSSNSPEHLGRRHESRDDNELKVPISRISRLVIIT